MIDMSQIKALVFDYGGTLDTNGKHWAHVLWEGYVHVGIPVTETQFREAYVFAERALAKSVIILPEDNFLELLIKKVDIETQELLHLGYWQTTESVRDEKYRAVADYCYQYAHRIVSLSRDMLRRYSQQYKMVLVSNFYGNIETILKDFDIDCFNSVIESAIVGIRKPDPRIYALGVESAGCKPNEVIVIGDSYSKDILPAKSLGCHTVWLKGEGWDDKESYDLSVPDAVIYQITDLSKIIP
jgi:HAD superfamily hydrolase (TIGR01549 family)